MKGGEGAHHLRRAGSHGEGANFSTYSPLASTAAEANGTAHCQKCSVFSFGHQNQEYTQNIKGVETRVSYLSLNGPIRVKEPLYS